MNSIFLHTKLHITNQHTNRAPVLLFTNFLNALIISNITPKRLLLQTGGKHLGPTLSPQEETDPRFHGEPNFYFLQEDFLWEWSRANKTHWNVTRPGFIIGAVREAAMNIAYGLAIFVSVQNELGRDLSFLGKIATWDVEKNLSSAKLIAYRVEWTIVGWGSGPDPEYC